jgi:hypothetical protein
MYIKIKFKNNFFKKLNSIIFMAEKKKLITCSTKKGNVNADDIEKQIKNCIFIT